MRRLFWVGVGAAVAVAGARRLGLLDTPGGGRDAAPQADGSLGAAALAAQAARTAFRAGATTAGAVRSLGDARRELLAGMAEREAQLRHDLVGDVDVDALRAERETGRDAGRGSRHRASGTADARGAVPPAWHHDPEARAASREARARRGWADEPTEDPEDDGDVPYSFY